MVRLEMIDFYYIKFIKLVGRHLSFASIPGMFLIKSSRFDKALDKATSELLMEPDWDINLQVCDIVRGQEVTPKYAIALLKKKLNTDNPHVCMLALSLLESLMKNCGTPMHDEVCGTDFVMSLLDHLHSTEEIWTKVVGLIQNWEYAFKNNPNYHSLHNAFAEIKRSGATLPPFRESEAMFAAEVAPGWKDGDSCYRCRASFNTFRRKHHCRNCGNVFCSECTTGRAVIPKFGIEREVRVCETCLPTLTGAHREAPAASRTDGGTSQSQSAARTEAEKAARDRELQLREEEELQLALALSASEAESKQKIDGGHPLYPTSTAAASEAPVAAPPTTATPPAQPPTASSVEGNGEGTEVDAELAHYLNRNYWTNRASVVGSDADSVVAPMVTPTAPIFNPPVNPDYEPSVRVPAEGLDLPGVPPLTTEKQEEFLKALRKSLDVFVNRMRINSQRGRSIANDSTIQTLFHTLHVMHPQLLQYASGLEQRRGEFSASLFMISCASNAAPKKCNVVHSSFCILIASTIPSVILVFVPTFPLEDFVDLRQ
ncbi:unnamed protein product [Schistocephalus solidus]|uniref:Hepatocyte growth factor-regulated tyrosine kinase substrate n=1 Tax=Schistocephalus solidus TaxID=70667 RepID=A0A183T6T6_SCHSO|nr:unnamed protein product [Schistocephalus solidus]